MPELEKLLAFLNKEECETFMTYKFVMGQRYGQAFFNALNEESRQRLSGSLADPFYRDSFSAIEDAIEYLTKP